MKSQSYQTPLTLNSAKRYNQTRDSHDICYQKNYIMSTNHFISTCWISIQIFMGVITGSTVEILKILIPIQKMTKALKGYHWCSTVWTYLYMHELQKHWANCRNIGSLELMQHDVTSIKYNPKVSARLLILSKKKITKIQLHFMHTKRYYVTLSHCLFWPLLHQVS